MESSINQDIENLSRRIRELRLSKGLTQEKMSELMDMDDGTYRRLESGRNKNPTFRTLLRLCRALQIEVGELFNYSILK